MNILVLWFPIPGYGQCSKACHEQSLVYWVDLSVLQWFIQLATVLWGDVGPLNVVVVRNRWLLSVEESALCRALMVSCWSEVASALIGSCASWRIN